MPAATMEDIAKRVDDTSKVVDDIVRQINEGTLTKEDGARLETELAALKDQVAKQSLTLPGAEEENKKKRFNLGGMARAMAMRLSPKEIEKRGLGRELDICVETAKANAHKITDEAVRATIFLTKDDTAAGILIPVEVSPETVDPLRPVSVMNNLGQRTITGVTGDPFRMLKRNTGGVAYHIKETGTPTLSKMSFSTTEARKKKMVSLMGLTEEMRQWGSPELDRMIEDEMYEVIMLLEDLTAVYGDGTEYEPRGIWNLTGTQSYTVGANGDHLSYLHHHEAYSKLVNANVRGRNLGLLTSWNALKFWLREKNTVTTSGSTAYYTLPMTLEALQRIISGITKGVEFSTQLPENLVQGSASDCTPTILGDFAQQIKVMWGGRVLQFSDDATVSSMNAFEQGLRFYKVTQWYDFLYRQPEAFCKLVGVKTTT